MKLSKRLSGISRLVILAALIFCTACFAADGQCGSLSEGSAALSAAESETVSQTDQTDQTAHANETADQTSESAAQNLAATPDLTEYAINKEEPMSQNHFYIQVNDQILTAAFADGIAASSLEELLEKGPLTFYMEDYGGWEKVGSLPHSLSRRDTHINAGPGDIMLYQGNQMVIFYGNNSWSYSPLGKIEGLTAGELKAALGKGNIEVTLLTGIA